MGSTTDMHIISPAINRSLAKQVETMARQLLDKKTDLDETGLLGGKAGIVLLFAYLSKLFPEKEALRYCWYEALKSQPCYQQTIQHSLRLLVR